MDDIRRSELDRRESEGPGLFGELARGSDCIMSQVKTRKAIASIL